MTNLVRGMICRECGERAAVGAVHVCEICFGPLDIDYDRDAIAARLTRALIESRPRTMWRYAELLPLTGPPIVARDTGMTPLVRAERLGRALGIDELYIKNEGVSHPSLSFKDRVVGVAIAKARELGLKTVACSSTGNLGNATAALAAAADMQAVIFIPEHVEAAKVLASSVYGARVIAVRGSYDDVNRLCSELAERPGWGFLNINLKPFYAEGSKTVAYEIAEQLGWRQPAHVVVPVAGGSLLAKMHEGFADLGALGLCPGPGPRMYAVQAAACAPLARMIIDGRDEIQPIKDPVTIARSLAIGNPADAVYARAAVLASGGFAGVAGEDEIVAGMRLLAESEGIFGETAGGVAVAALQQLRRGTQLGAPTAPGPVVVVLTGQGLKTPDPLYGVLPRPEVINPRRADFDALARNRAI